MIGNHAGARATWCHILWNLAFT